MIKGYVVNNSARSRYIFKQHVSPGTKIPLIDMYKKYKYKYKGEFDVDFLEWLNKNKIPKDFEVVVHSIDTEEFDATEETQVENPPTLESDEYVPGRKYIPNKMTSKEISELKMKDNPKDLICRIMSIHKLRRALTMCKGRAGKETLIRLIKQRIDEIK